MSRGTQHISIRIPRELMDAARTQAEAEDTTVSDFLRECLMEWTGYYVDS